MARIPRWCAPADRASTHDRAPVLLATRVLRHTSSKTMRTLSLPMNQKVEPLSSSACSLWWGKATDKPAREDARPTSRFMAPMRDFEIVGASVSRRSRNQSSADFQVCCVADFQIRRPSELHRAADLEVGRQSRFGNLRYRASVRPTHG